MKINPIKTGILVYHGSKKPIGKKCVTEPTKSGTLPASNEIATTIENIVDHVLGCHVNILFIGIHKCLLMEIYDTRYLLVVGIRGEFKIWNIGRIVSTCLDTAENDSDNAHT